MTETIVACPDPDCGTPMARTHADGVPDGTAQFAVFECEACGRKCALMFDTVAGQPVSAEAQSWVENQLRDRGFMFPSDFSGNTGRFR